MKTIRCEAAVLGAGPAGVCAALAAARTGAQTLLVSDRPVLGGNSSSEIRVWTRGATGGGNLFAEEMGIWGELKLRNLRENPTGNVFGWDDILLDAVLHQPRLSLLLNTACTGVHVAENRIQSATLFSSRTQETLLLEAGIFIDCTGDGAVGAWAGLPYRTGRENREQFGEPLALRQADERTLGCSILIQTKRVGYSVPYRAPSYAYSLREVEALIGRGGRIVTADMQGSDCWWFEYGGQLNTISDDQTIYLELKRIATGIYNYIKNSGRYDADNLSLEWMGTLAGKRASRRLVGENTLVQQDVEENRCARDAVCWGGWYMDSHPSEGIQSAKEECVQRSVHVYGIPFGCFYHASCHNLLFAGRNASQSHVALTSTRIMNTCALMGQACGTAAALCLQHGFSPAQLHQRAFAELQQKLALEDVLLDFPLVLPEGTRVLASSQLAVDAPPDGTELPLDQPSYIAYPAQCGGITLQVRSDRSRTLCGTLSRASLPSRRVAKAQTPVQFDLTEGINLLRIRPQDGESFVMLYLDAAPGCALLGGPARPGIQAGPCMKPKVFHPALHAEGELYRPEALLDGYLRPWNGPHAWAAAGASGRVTLQWPQPKRLTSVRLYFDPDLSAELTSSHCERWDDSHHYTARKGLPPQLVRNYRLTAQTHTGEVLLAHVVDNAQRLCVHPFDPVDVTALTLDIQDTWGGDAVVYAILPLER